MGHTSTQIYAPVFVSDVQAVLVTNDNSVSRLCRSASINRWAKYKPVNIDSPNHSHSGNDANWYKGDDGKCGLILPVGVPGSTPAQIANLYKGNAWSYAGIPSPGWARLGDFDGYDHGARPFIRTGIPVGAERNVNLQLEHSFRLSVRHQVFGNSLGISDFDDLGMDLNCRLVAALYRQDPMANASPAFARSVVSEHTVGGAPNQSPYVDLEFSASDLQYGDYMWALLYLVGTSAGSACFPIPYDDANHVVVKIYLTDRIALSATIVNIGQGQGSAASPVPTDGGQADVAISLRFNNPYSGAVTVGPSGRFRLRAELGHGYGETELIGGTVTVPAGSTGYQATFTAPKLFAKAMSMLRPEISQTDTSLRITAMDTTGATDSWQALTPAQTIYFKR